MTRRSKLKWALVNHPLLLGQIVFSLPLIHLSLRTVGFNRTLNLLKRSSPDKISTDDHNSKQETLAAETGQLVNAVANRLGMTCLDRSLLLWWLLRREGVHAELKLGAPLEKRQEFIAHAWVECCGTIINDIPQVRDQYAVLTTYETF